MLYEVITDRGQAQRVKTSALQLFDQVADDWALPVEQYRSLLGWAAELHEIGLVINYSGVQRHSAYRNNFV